MKRLKTGGRITGTPNKTTKEVKIILTDFLYSNLSELNTIFEQLPPIEKMKIIIQVAKLLIPQPVEQNETEGEIYKGGQFSIEMIEIVHTTKT